MASNPSIPTIVNKLSSQSKASNPSPSSIQFQSINNDSFGAKRSSINSFGAGQYTRPQGAPRNSHNRKSQKKNYKKYPKIDDDTFAETHAMRSTTNRRGQTSITHLLNYSVGSSYSYPQHQHHHHQRSAPRSRPSWAGVDKLRYVYGNYRFIVDPNRDYSPQITDADVHVDWNDIFQVLASESQLASCPICLETPVAPRIAKCGHIFCLPCVIRYMYSDDDSRPQERRYRSKACPLCWDHFTLSEVKPVRWYKGQEKLSIQEGQDVVLRLMKRIAGNTLALPRDGAEAIDNSQTPWYFAAQVLDYSRIIKGTPDYMVTQINSEIIALEQQEKIDELMFGDDNAEWVRKSINRLNEMRTGFTSDQNHQVSMINNTTSQTPQSPSSLKQSQSIIQPAHSNLLHNHSQHSVTSEYYFYQALPHFYLSSLDIRILKKAFGTYDSFPSTVLPRVERIITGQVVDDDLRKQRKWLSHLPKGCEVNFLECDWTDIVPSDVLDEFKTEIEQRRKRNEEKEAREERDRIRAEREEEKRYAFVRRRQSDHVEGENALAVQTDKFQQDDFVPLQKDNDHEIISSTPPVGNRNGASFSSLAQMSTSPNASRTVWGTPAIATSSSASPPLRPFDESHDDGWFQGWEEALLENQMPEIEMATNNSKPVSSGKKKKGKKITLMSTNVRRGA